MGFVMDDEDTFEAGLEAGVRVVEERAEVRDEVEVDAVAVVVVVAVESVEMGMFALDGEGTFGEGRGAGAAFLTDEWGPLVQPYTHTCYVSCRVI